MGRRSIRLSGVMLLCRYTSPSNLSARLLVLSASSTKTASAQDFGSCIFMFAHSAFEWYGHPMHALRGSV